MKATDFCNFFEFSIERIAKEEYEKVKDSDFAWADENADKIYAVRDDQGVFQTRYINDISDLSECFDSLLNDYIDEDVEEDGFKNIEYDTEKSYYEQMLDWMNNDERYKGTFVQDIVYCLTNPSAIEDDVEMIA